MTVRRALLAAVASLVMAPAAAQACQPAFSSCSSNAFVNQPVASDAQVDPNSGTYVNDLLSWTAAKNTWIDSTSYGVTVFTVPAWQPTVSVKVTTNNGNPAAPSLQAAWQQVPIPPNAKPAQGTDSQMVVIQPDTDKMWEFWGGTSPLNDGTLNWKAAWGGAFLPGETSGSYSTGLGRYYGHWYDGYEQRWGATASSISVLAGLITASDLFSGSIDHAIALGVPNAQAEYFVSPAQRTDGNVATPDPTRPSAIPMGQRFYIPASVNLAKVPCHYAASCMIDRALQRYGAFVRDTTGSALVLYAEDTTDEGLPSIYTSPNGFWAGQSPATIVDDLDWKDLVALNSQPEQCCWTK